MPTAATVTLARMSTPSMPTSAYEGSCPRSSSASTKIGWSHRLRVLSPSGRPRAMPSRTDGIASRTSGPTITHGDSWIPFQTSRGPLNEPQNVRPMSRNM